MEVCIVSTFYYPFKGGIEAQIYEMIKELYKYGVNVKVFSVIPKNDLPRLKEFPYAECIPVVVKKLFIVPKSYPPPIAFYSPFRLSKIFREKCGDIKLIHSFGELIGSLAFNGRTKNNIFIHSQHNALKNSASFTLWKIVGNLSTEFIYRGYFQKCKKLVAISNHIAEELKNYCQIDEKNIKIIPNGLNLKKFDFDKKGAEEFKQNNDIDKFFIFTTGRVVKEKGFQQLIKAISIMKNKDVILGVGGEGYYKEDLIKLAEKLKINAKFFGFLEYKTFRKAFCACDVFVTPSLFQEPFGLVSIEAMAFRKPVIASAVGGIPEIIENNITGMLYDPYNYKELAEKLDIIYSDKNLRKKFGENGRKRVEKKYNWDVLIKDWIKFYKSLT